MAFKNALKQWRGDPSLGQQRVVLLGAVSVIACLARVRCSIPDEDDSYQNALVERVNGILKGELLLQSPQVLEQARKMVREAMDIYNAERSHHALKYRTPDVVHRGF